MKLAYTSLAKYYDLLFSGKDYLQESEFLKSIVKTRLSNAKSILDVGCGTGNHLNLLTDVFETLWGVDLNREILEIAKSKSRKIRYQIGGMKDFNINLKFDVITCLYSVFNYNLTSSEAIQTLSNFKRHLNQDGITIIALYTPHNVDEEIGLNLGSNKEVEVAKIDQFVFDPKTHMETSDFLVLLKTPDGIDFKIEKNHQFRIYDPDEFRKLCYQAGFSKIDFFDRFKNKPITKQTKYPVAVIQ